MRLMPGLRRVDREPPLAAALPAVRDAPRAVLAAPLAAPRPPLAALLVAPLVAPLAAPRAPVLAAPVRRAPPRVVFTAFAADFPGRAEVPPRPVLERVDLAGIG